VDRTVEHLHTFLVEHYRPGVTAEECQSTADRVRAAAEQMGRAGAGIRFLHSTFVPEDEAAFCVFEAQSSDLVEEAYERADVRFERIVHALEMERGS
jgi:hypothetical protein